MDGHLPSEANDTARTGEEPTRPGNARAQQWRSILIGCARFGEGQVRRQTIVMIATILSSIQRLPSVWFTDILFSCLTVLDRESHKPKKTKPRIECLLDFGT